MKKMIIFGIILFLILPGITMADEKYEDYDLLLDMVNDLQGEVQEGDIVFNGVISQEFMEEEEMVKLGEEIKVDLNLLGREIDPLIVQEEVVENFYTKEVIFDRGFSQINYNGYDGNGNAITIILSSYLDTDTLKGETYLCINIVKVSDFLEINDIIDKVRNIFKISNEPIDITSALIAELPGKVRDEDMEEKVNNTLKRYKAEVIEEYSDEFVSSYTIYSPLIEDYLLIDEKKINLNIAIRYNEYEDKTYIFIGTPIITIGY